MGTVTFDLSAAQPVKAADQQPATPDTSNTSAQPVTFDLSTAQPVKTPPPVTFDLSTAQSVQTSQNPTQKLSDHDQLIRNVVDDPLPDGSMARKVVQGIAQDSTGSFVDRLENIPRAYWHAAKAIVSGGLNDTTWQKVKAVANMPLVAGLQNAAGALPVIMGDLAEHELKKSNHPTLSKIAGAYTGEKRGEAELEAGMTSPLSLGIMAATGGLGSVEGAVEGAATRLGLSKEAISMAAKYGPQVARLVNAGFAIGGIKSAYDSIPEVKKAFDAGDTNEVARLLTENVGNLGMSIYAGLHALGSVLPEGSATKEEAAAKAKGRAVKPEAEQPQPLPSAPVVKIVDTPLQAELHLEQAKAEAAQGQESAKPAGQKVEAAQPEKTAYEYKPLDVAESTEGKTFYHGTRSPEFTNIEEAQPSKSSSTNLLGPGFYMTDHPEVGARYGQHGNLLSGTLGDLKLIDLEGPADSRLKSALKSILPESEYNEIEQQAGDKTGKDMYSAFRNQIIKEHGGDTLPDYQVDLIHALTADNVDGFRYEGTKLGTSKDNSLVLFGDPENGGKLGKIGAIKNVRTEASKSEGSGSTESAGHPTAEESNAPSSVRSNDAGTRAGTSQVGGQPASTVVPENFVPAVSRDAILAEAQQRIINNSPVLQQILDPTKLQTSDDIDAALNSASKHIETGNDPRVGARIGFEQIKSLARDLNLKPEELMSNPSGTPANAEQVTAARMMLQQSSENVLDLARKAAANSDDPSAKADLAAAVAKHQEIASKVRSYAAEAGRALVSHKIGVADVPASKIAEALSKVPKEVLDQATRIAGGLDPNDPNYTAKANQVLKIADALQDLKPETLDLAARLLARINPAEPGYISKTNKLIEEITPSTTPDKLFEIYRNSLLSSPSTLIKKTASESAALMLEAATKGLTGALEQGKAKLEGRDPDAIASEAYWYSKGAVRAMANARPILSGEFDLANAPGFEESFPRAVKGTVGQLVRIPAETLSRATNLVYYLNYSGELEAQAAQIAKSERLSGDAFRARQHYLVENPTEEMTKKANKTGLHNTFQSELGSTGSKLQALVHSNNALRFLLPFVKTPLNLVKMTAEYSPYGALKGTAHGDLTAQARGLIGSSLATGIAYLAGQGLITGGGPTDFRKREAKESTGWQPYSIKIGDKYYRYNRLEPLGLLFSAVADTVHGIMKDEDPAISNAKAASVVNHISRNVQDLPFLMQISNMLDALTQLSSKTPERVIDNLLASAVVPAGVKAAAQTLDPTMRSPQRNGLDEPLTGLKQTIEERVPGLTKNVSPDIDITGQPVQRPSSPANPFPVSTDKKNPVTDELARMGVSVGPVPQAVIVRRNGVPITYAMSPEEGRQIQRGEVQQFYQIMSRVISQPGWKTMPDFDKKLVIDSVHKRVTANRLGRLFQLRQGEGLPRPTLTLPSMSSSQPQ